MNLDYMQQFYYENIEYLCKEFELIKNFPEL